jgi:hypothetical protein
MVPACSLPASINHKLLQLLIFKTKRRLLTADAGLACCV